MPAAPVATPITLWSIAGEEGRGLINVRKVPVNLHKCVGIRWALLTSRRRKWSGTSCQSQADSVEQMNSYTPVATAETVLVKKDMFAWVYLCSRILWTNEAFAAWRYMNLKKQICQYMDIIMDNTRVVKQPCTGFWDLNQVRNRQDRGLCGSCVISLTASHLVWRGRNSPVANHRQVCCCRRDREDWFFWTDCNTQCRRYTGFRLSERIESTSHFARSVSSTPLVITSQDKCFRCRFS